MEPSDIVTFNEMLKNKQRVLQVKRDLANIRRLADVYGWGGNTLESEILRSSEIFVKDFCHEVCHSFMNDDITPAQMITLMSRL